MTRARVSSGIVELITLMAAVAVVLVLPAEELVPELVPELPATKLQAAVVKPRLSRVYLINHPASLEDMVKRLFLILITAVCVLSMGAQTVDFDAMLKRHGLVDVTTISPSITVDLKYATTDNFVHRNMYGSLRNAYLHPDAAVALKRAMWLLKRVNRNLGFIVYDAARPRSVQQVMWDAVKGTPNERYVAKPFNGGPHNYGIAVDIALTYRDEPVDMGTPFDTFTEEAHITAEDALVAQGRISSRARANRLILRAVLCAAGYDTFTREWWHFTRYDMKYTRQHIQLLDF